MSLLDQAVQEMIAEQVAAAEKRIRESLGASPGRTLSFREALQHLSMSEYTLRRLCKEKCIPHRVYGSEGSKNPRYLFSENSLNAWILEQERMNASGLE